MWRCGIFRRGGFTKAARSMQEKNTIEKIKKNEYIIFVLLFNHKIGYKY